MHGVVKGKTLGDCCIQFNKSACYGATPDKMATFRKLLTPHKTDMQEFPPLAYNLGCVLCVRGSKFKVMIRLSPNKLVHMLRCV